VSRPARPPARGASARSPRSSHTARGLASSLLPLAGWILSVLVPWVWERAKIRVKTSFSYPRVYPERVLLGAR